MQTQFNGCLKQIRFKARRRCLLLSIIVAVTVTCGLRFYDSPCSFTLASCVSEPVTDQVLPPKYHPNIRLLPTLDGTANHSWCGTHVLRPLIDREPQTWQMVEDRSVLVFSAYVDHRVEVGGPFVRVVANGWQANYNDIGALYCQLWYQDFEVSLAVGPAVYDLIYPSTLYPKMWVGHFILCPLPLDLNVFPYAVSITARGCSNASNTLLVLNTQPNPLDTFSLCLPPLYGKLNNWTSIIELIEIHKIFGVTEFTFYNFSASKMIGKALESYRMDPSVNVNIVQWQFPSDKLNNYFSQHDSLNDCLYRSDSRGNRYVVISDLDEVITPRKHSNWKDMVVSMSRPNIGAYLFQHAYFRRNSTPGEEGPYLVTQQSLWRTDVVTPPGDIRCKSLYDAARTVKVNIHSPYQLVSGTQRHVVNPTIGMLHHYRHTPMESFIKHPANYRFIEDKEMLKYKAKLKYAVERRIHLVQH